MGSSQSEHATSSRDELVSKIRAQLKTEDPAKVRDVGGVFLFKIIHGSALYSWTLDLNKISVDEGEPAEDPDATFTIKESDFVQLVTGRTDPKVIFRAGKSSITGDIMRAMQLQAFIVLNSDSK